MFRNDPLSGLGGDFPTVQPLVDMAETEDLIQAEGHADQADDDAGDKPERDADNDADETVEGHQDNPDPPHEAIEPLPLRIDHRTNVTPSLTEVLAHSSTAPSAVGGKD